MSNFSSLYQALEATVRSDGCLGVGLRWRLADAYECIIARPYAPQSVAAAIEELLA